MIIKQANYKKCTSNRYQLYDDRILVNRQDIILMKMKELQRDTRMMFGIEYSDETAKALAKGMMLYDEENESDIKCGIVHLSYGN